ncbi:MAG: hypothetical protein KKC05_02395, partial [Nanoarchaeota archaeon]|nr:hypothetical protein [Nanoarchaeota archaeon]
MVVIHGRPVSAYDGVEDIDMYCQDIAVISHGEDRRQNGEPVIRHAHYIAEHMDEIIIHPKYKKTARAAGWMHDVVEDSDSEEGEDNIHVFNPYSPYQRVQFLNGSMDGKRYLNTLLSDGGSEGRWVSYIVDRVTYRKERGVYEDYVRRIFRFKPDGTTLKLLDKLAKKGDRLSFLNIITAVLKMVDRDHNTDPEEERNTDKLMEEYAELEIASYEELRDFYYNHKVLDAFREIDNLSYNPEFFKRVLVETFRDKMTATAIDNLFFYLPLAEDALLRNIPQDNGLYDSGKVRRMIEKVYANSLAIGDRFGGHAAFDLDVIERVGMNRGRDLE